ncbi:MAG: AAA family ATPase, partial [Rhodosalinus sp.]
MKLRSIRLENVRRFEAAVRLDDIGDGLNVLSEPNEHGKSTLFDALQAVFLRPHGSKDKEIRALRPHSGGAPEVAVEIETAEGRFTLTKRWWSKPVARVEQGGRLIAQADAAEDWIGRLMGGDGAGPSGLLWVRQGLTGLADGSGREQQAALAARRDLLSSVTGEVEAMTGGRRMDAALAQCAAELADYATGTGRPKAGGPWKAAQDEAERLAAEEAELAETARALHAALTERKRKRRELAEIEDPEAAAARAARLEEAEAAFRAAERHAERVEVERRRVQAAEGQLRDAKARLDALRAALAERTAAARAADAAMQTQETARTSATEAEAALDDARKQLTERGEALARAEAAHRAALRRQAQRDGAARRADLSERLKAAEAARAEIEAAAAHAAQGPDAKTLRRLEELDAGARTARALRDAAAPQIVMQYAAGRAGSVTRDGAALPDGEAVPVPKGADLDLRGLGRLTVRPGAGPQAADEAESAARALAKALDAAGAATLAEAREAAARR